MSPPHQPAPLLGQALGAPIHMQAVPTNQGMLFRKLSIQDVPSSINAPNRRPTNGAAWLGTNQAMALPGTRHGKN